MHKKLFGCMWRCHFLELHLDQGDAMEPHSPLEKKLQSAICVFLKGSKPTPPHGSAFIYF